MMLKSYGVTLTRLTVNDLEKVRKWRNDPKIQNTMLFKDYITKEQQRQWFQTINNDCNYYFIINYNKNDIGLVNLKNIDLSSAEAGIFIGEYEYWDTMLGFCAVLALNDFAFNDLNLKYLLATIIDNNKRAVRFNRLLGYELIEKKDDDVGLYKLEKEAYFDKKKNIERYL